MICAGRTYLKPICEKCDNVDECKPIGRKTMIEVPSKEDYVSLANRHNELVELVKSASSALGKMQEELDAMPSGYRNAQDIKNLKGRIERIEAGGLSSSRIEQLEECCKNTVASGKALEARVGSLSIEVGDASKRTQRADNFMDKLRNI